MPFPSINPTNIHNNKNPYIYDFLETNYNAVCAAVFFSFTNTKNIKTTQIYTKRLKSNIIFSINILYSSMSHDEKSTDFQPAHIINNNYIVIIVPSTDLKEEAQTVPHVHLSSLYAVSLAASHQGGFSVCVCVV